MLGRMTGFVSAPYDFNHGRATTRAYVVASSYRSGSTLLCHLLWETGIMGAPWEYLNYENEMRGMWARLRAKGPDDYVRRLLACRTSRNGVFGLKAHIHHFEAALRSFPGLLAALPPPVHFIYIDRRDKVAQAVSMAKAIQTNAWLSLATPRQLPLFYSPEFIEACLQDVTSQCEGWTRWFEKKKIDPFVVQYEDLLKDPAQVIDSIVRLIGAKGSEPDPVVLPDVERQSDQTNTEWIGRFQRDRGAADRMNAAE